MRAQWVRLIVLGLMGGSLTLAGCSGDTGPAGPQGPPGPPGAAAIDASAVSDEVLEALDVVSEVTGVTVASPPVVTFTLKTTGGIPIIGIVPFWEESDRYVRFTITKLVPGSNGDPASWVSYTRDADTNAPDYDTGSSLVDNGDGSYQFTFATDVANVPGVSYDPGLTHRVAGQLGSNSVPLEPQNFVFDFLPAGGAVTTTRNIAVMDSCNECHDDLVFHGRRFEVEYCVNCHNPDLALGEGNMSYMIHRIHAAGSFALLDDGVDYSEVTYPQDLNNCRKCHNGDDEATAQGNNWMTVPSLAACFGCHEPADHPGGAPPADNSGCAECHPPAGIEDAHVTPNATPNNPNLLPGQRNITYELMDASVGVVGGGVGDVVINFRILSDGTPLDVTNLPQDLLDPDSYPVFLLAWAEPQDGIEEPADYNNFGNRGAQPNQADLGLFSPIETGMPIGTLSFNAGDGVLTATVTEPTLQFPMGATLRAVGLQGYFEQDLNGDGTGDVSLHSPAKVVAVTGDEARRAIVDNNKCAICHEWFEGHGGNRTFSMEICVLCHTPNTSSSGRTVVDPSLRELDIDLMAAIADGTLDASVVPNDPLTYPEDNQSLMDLAHGIHSSDDRTRPFQHVRGPNRQGYYGSSEVTFPRGASTANCLLCHLEGTYELPLDGSVLPTTVRTTGETDGQDAGVPAAELAFLLVPNDTDWINTPTANSCFMCHTSGDAMSHMLQNGALLSNPAVPAVGPYANRMEFGSTFESCTICHGPGKTADLEDVHDQ